jgi:hypothetical protein
MTHRAWLRSHLPDEGELEAALAATLGGGSAKGVALIERSVHDYASSFPAEIVRCRAGGEELLLLCKYGIEQSQTTHGHRGGVAYEAAVYRQVLQPLRLTTPPLRGTFVVPASGATWLFLDYLAGGTRVDETDSPAASLRLAAQWAAAFHRSGEKRLETQDLPPLTVYDREYYAAWARRTQEYAQPSGRRLSWLPPLCAAFEELVDELLEPPLTVIHGEFTPHNVLIREGAAYPTDWESTAVGCWAIDLVSLMQKWPGHVVRACKEDYVRTRWPDGSPEGIDRLLEVAGLYWDFRWLGDRPEWMTRRRVRARLPQLRMAGKRLGAI